MILSRRDPELIRTLFELEVPEIADGLVEIRGVAREPGYRSKIAVESHAQGVDPVGACVGPRGSRVRMVVSELRGEKIDIIPWNNEPARFVAKALSPARVREVYIDDETKEATVVVPDDQLALAIGKEGLNARLAARLTGWKVDIQSDTEFAQAEAEAAFSGVEGDDFTGRCVAILSTGKRCPNAALPGSRFCGVPAHQELAKREASGEDLGDLIVQPGAPEPTTEEAVEAVEGEAVAAEEPVTRPSRAVDGRSQREPQPVADDRGGRAGCAVTSRSARAPAAAARRRRRELLRFTAQDGALTAGPEARAGRLHLPAARVLRARGRARAFARVLRQAVRVDPALSALYTETDHG